MGALFARRARSGKAEWAPTLTWGADARVHSGRQFFFNLPDGVHERFGGRRVRATAFGNETVVQAQPGQFERQQHTIAVVNLALEVKRQRASNPPTSQNDLFGRGEVPDQDSWQEAILHRVKHAEGQIALGEKSSHAARDRRTHPWKLAYFLE